MCVVLIRQVAAGPIAPTSSPDRGRTEPEVHTINNANPYQGVSITEGHGKYPVIFELLQNVQTSRSTYKVTSFIDFGPYLEYFQQFETYLEAFKASVWSFEGDPVLREFREETLAAAGNKAGEACKHPPVCYVQPLFFRLRYQPAQRTALQQQRERCMARYMQACLVLKQFEYILNMTEYVNENYLRIKERFLRAIDYVENIDINEGPPSTSTSRRKRGSRDFLQTSLTLQEDRYLVGLLTELANWDPTSNTTHRAKRFVAAFASVGALIGSLINGGQIKRIKENIALLQDATILQSQQIAELARYEYLTAVRVRPHDKQIYRLQYKMLIVETGIKEMIDVSNFQIYTSYHINVAQTVLSHLQTGMVSIENNIDKIFEYLRVMTDHKATSAVIPPVALKRLLLRIEDHLCTNPRLKLPYDPRTRQVWKYYSVIKIVQQR